VLSENLFELYILLLAATFFISYFVGLKGIKESGLFLPYTIFSLVLNFVIMLIIIIWWALTLYGVNEFGFLIGLGIGILVIVVAEVTLLVCFVFSSRYLLRNAGGKGTKKV